MACTDDLTVLPYLIHAASVSLLLSMHTVDSATHAMAVKPSYPTALQVLLFV